MNQIEHNGTTLNYHIYGTGPVTLFFVHGAYIDQTYWAAQVSIFQRDYTVVTMDLAGHGKSGRERATWTVEGMADDIAAIIKHHYFEKVIFIGHSMGANLALMATIQNPDPIIGFIAIDNFKNAGAPIDEKYRSQVDYILNSMVKNFAQTNEQYARMALGGPKTPKHIIERVALNFRNAYEPMGQQIMPVFFKLYKSEQSLLPELKLNLNLINVDYYPTNVEALKKEVINGFTLKEINGTCHYPMLENPDQFNDALTETIEQILNGK